MAKNLPEVQETLVWSLGRENPLKKGMATHSNILAWEFHRQRSLVGYSPWCRKEQDMTKQLMQTYTHTHTSFIDTSSYPLSITRYRNFAFLSLVCLQWGYTWHIQDTQKILAEGINVSPPCKRENLLGIFFSSDFKHF